MNHSLQESIARFQPSRMVLSNDVWKFDEDGDINRLPDPEIYYLNYFDRIILLDAVGKSDHMEVPRRLLNAAGEQAEQRWR